MTPQKPFVWEQFLWQFAIQAVLAKLIDCVFQLIYERISVLNLDLMRPIICLNFFHWTI